jgi:hypothetical protein
VIDYKNEGESTAGGKEMGIMDGQRPSTVGTIAKVKSLVDDEHFVLMRRDKLPWKALGSWRQCGQ